MYGPRLSLLEGALSLYSVSCTSPTKKSCNTKVVFNHFDRDSYMYVCMYGWMDGWMDGWMHACMHACMYVYAYPCNCINYICISNCQSSRTQTLKSNCRCRSTNVVLWTRDASDSDENHLSPHIRTYQN